MPKNRRWASALILSTALLTACQGPQGEIGPVGPVGPSAYQAWLDAGNTGTPEQFVASTQGQSAYQLWVAQGNTGTVEQFLASLKGAAGPKGDTGATGPKGDTGLKGDTGTAGKDGNANVLSSPWRNLSEFELMSTQFSGNTCRQLSRYPLSDIALEAAKNGVFNLYRQSGDFISPVPLSLGFYGNFTEWYVVNLQVKALDYNVIVNPSECRDQNGNTVQANGNNFKLRYVVVPGTQTLTTLTLAP